MGSSRTLVKRIGESVLRERRLGFDGLGFVWLQRVLSAETALEPVEHDSEFFQIQVGGVGADRLQKP